MESRLLATGIGVQHPTDRFDLLGDGAGAALLGALEGHMLKQVGNAHLAGLFVAAAGIDPDAQGGAFKLTHGVADHRQAIGKFGYF